MLEWTTSAPAPDKARFFTPLDGRMENIALQLVQSFDHQHSVSVVNVGSALGGRSLASIANLVPEIARSYGDSTGHQMKTVVFVDRGIGYYRTPYRGRRCRVKAAGVPADCEYPHVLFVNDYEAGKFLKFGTATLAIVVQRGGIFGDNPGRVMELGRALSTGILEAILVVTDGATSPGDVQFAHRYFKQYKKSVGFVDLM